MRLRSFVFPSILASPVSAHSTPFWRRRFGATKIELGALHCLDIDDDLTAQCQHPARSPMERPRLPSLDGRCVSPLKLHALMSGGAVLSFAASQSIPTKAIESVRQNSAARSAHDHTGSPFAILFDVTRFQCSSPPLPPGRRGWRFFPQSPGARGSTGVCDRGLGSTRWSCATPSRPACAWW